MADLRNPQAKARDAYLESTKGRAACDLGSLLLGRGDGGQIFLRNRIEAAFLAGWKAAEDFHINADPKEWC